MFDPELFDSLNESQDGQPLRAWLTREKLTVHNPEDALDLLVLTAYQKAATAEDLLADLRYCRAQLNQAIIAVVKHSKKEVTQ